MKANIEDIALRDKGRFQIRENDTDQDENNERTKLADQCHPISLLSRCFTRCGCCYCTHNCIFPSHLRFF